MCDYSLQFLQSRAAKVDDQLETKTWGTGTTGFCSPDDPATAVCLLPGTELSIEGTGLIKGKPRVATFCQIDKDKPFMHHDALRYVSGKIVLVNALGAGRKARVLQLPAAPKTAAEAKEQERLPVVA